MQRPDDIAAAAGSPSRRGRIPALAAAILASSLGFIDGSVVSVAIPAIRGDHGASFHDIQWVSNSYMLFLSALILVGGAAGDRFGQRRALAAGVALFALASVGCAGAATPGSLILWRAVQGVGAALMVPGSLALIAVTYPRSERGRAIGIWSMSSGIAAALGPIGGGALIDALGPAAWRWIFWINPPVGLITIALLLWRRPAVPQHLAPRRLDIAGAGLATVSLFLVSFGLTEAGAAAPRLVLVAGCIVAGVAAAGLFLWWESRAREPMLPLSLFRSRAFAGANILTFALYFALAGSLFFLPMTLVVALGLSEGLAGAVYLPFTLVMAFVAGRAGSYADTHGPRLPITLGSIAVAASFLAVALAIGMRSFVWGVLPAMALLGLGMGLVVAPLSTAVMTSVAEERSGAASGVNNGVSRIAGLFAVAGLGVVASLVYRSLVGSAPGMADYGQPAMGLSREAQALRAEAMIVTFAVVSGITALLSLASAWVAWAMMPGAPSPQPSAAPDARADV